MKKIFKLLLVLVVLLILVVVSVPLWIDSAAKTAIEEGGTYAMGVTTTLDDISISIFGGEATMSGLQIDNPEGYQSPHFLQLGEGHVAVSLKSLRSDKIVIPVLRIDSVDLHLDRNDQGANYKVIMENLKKLESEEPEDSPGKKEFVIEEVVIRNVNVSAKLSIGGILKPTVPVVIDEMRFERVGEEGIPLSKLMGILLKGILNGVLRSGAGKLPGEILGGLEQGLGGLGGLGVKIIGDTAGGAGKVIEGVGKGVGKAVEGVGKGIGGLFGGKKKDEEKEEDK